MAVKKTTVESTLKNVTATLAFEGLKPSSAAAEANRKMLEGKISGTEARKIILNHYHMADKTHV